LYRPTSRASRRGTTSASTRAARTGFATKVRSSCVASCRPRRRHAYLSAQETYLGFVENYVDPWCARAEWEGFVAVVDKTLSARFARLVDQAPELIQTLYVRTDV
jgi:hypothetical protein